MKDLNLPVFSTIVPEEREQQLLAVIARHRAEIEKLIQSSQYTWLNFILPLEAMDNELHALWAPFAHLKSVADSRVPRDIYAHCKDAIVSFMADVSQNEGVYNAFREIREGEEYTHLSSEQKKAVDNALRDFRLAGVHLPTEQKARYKELKMRLSNLERTFQENLLDSAKVWHKDITEEAHLIGLSPMSQARARQNAKEAGVEGWRLLLEGTTVQNVMTFARNRDLRREVHEAWNTRASDRFPVVGVGDNAPVYEEILSLRQKLAELLGFANYAEVSVAKKMAKSTDEVMGFLQELASYAKPKAAEEYAEVVKFAEQTDGLRDFQIWDLSYYSEHLKEKRFSFSDEEVREYFPLPKVLAGLFAITERLYGIRFIECFGVDVWHPDVRFFEMLDANDTIIGGIYLDLYARGKEKDDGAWADRAVMRWRMPSGDIQNPVGYLICNFEPPADGCVALLRHKEVVTLFHEFGHHLHYLLTKTEVWSLSGTGGVERDGVELPSQFMEHFCLEEESIGFISEHYQTGAKLPAELFEKMRAVKNFGKGLLVAQQLVFGIFDFRLHKENPRNRDETLDLYQEIFNGLVPYLSPEWVRVPNNFSHIFVLAYGAGYYSYVWALVLAVDAFGAFLREDGTIDWSMGEKFLNEILSRGGSRAMMENFVEFRGRKPSVDALLRHYGFIE